MNQDPKIYYVYDILCGWCYGFSPVIKKLFHKYSNRVKFEVLSGGMILHERVGPVSLVAPYIKDAYKNVESTTGVKFGLPYLEDLLGEGNMIMDSWMGSVALTAFKSFDSANSVLFAADLQNAIYFNGISPLDIDHFADLAESYGIEKDDFLGKTNDPIIQYSTKQDFQMAQDLKVTGYPAVIVFYQDQYFLIARGYTDFDTLESRLLSVLGSTDNKI